MKTVNKESVHECLFMSKTEKALRVKESFSKESSLTKRRFFNNRITVSLPDLIEVQKDSYQWFWDKGLKELFSEINPIADFTKCSCSWR